MKKTIIFLLPLIFFSACGIYKTVTVDHLRLGMTRDEVEDIFGRPEKVLLVSMTEHGRQEISAYKIGNNDIYTLEFMNDLLVRYEFLREDVVYVPPPPLQPIVIVQPVRPQPVERPPVTRPLPTVEQGTSGRENRRTEESSRRPASEPAKVERTGERDRTATSDASRRESDSGQSNRGNRSSR